MRIIEEWLRANPAYHVPSASVYADDLLDDDDDEEGDRVVMGPAMFVEHDRVTVGSAARKAAQILDDREDKYNNRDQTVAKVTAGLWSAFLGVEISAADANLMMAMHKMARTRVDKDRDHYDDGCGYMSMALYAEKTFGDR